MGFEIFTTVAFWLSIVAGSGTILCQWLLSRHDIRGWYISIANQVVWTALVFVTGTYGLLIVNVILTVIAIRAIQQWNKKEKICPA